MDFEQLDKSVVVIGGFIERMESLMQEMMSGIAGHKDVEIIETTPPIVLPHFASPERGMKFHQVDETKNETIHANKSCASGKDPNRRDFGAKRWVNSNKTGCIG